MHIKLPQEESFQKELKQPVIWLEIKLSIRVSKSSPQNNLETSEEIFREKYISLELRQKIIDDLRLKKD